jgi:hypothetical protein
VGDSREGVAVLLKPFSAADLDAALSGVGIDTPVA